MRKTKLSLIVLLTMTAFLAPNSLAEIHEPRTYTSREGKLESVLNRFENHKMSLFEKNLVFILALKHQFKNPGPRSLTCKSNSPRYAMSVWGGVDYSTNSRLQQY